MTESRHLVQTDVKTGDAAADGLLKGIVAGIVTAAYLVVVGLVVGEGPGAVLARFAPNGGTSVATGTLVHLAVSAVFGALFGVGWHAIRRRQIDLPAWLAGLVYGVVLVLLAELALAVGSNSPLKEIRFVHFALAHLVYGLTLGFLVYRGREA